MSLFGSAPTMVFDGVSQPTKPSVEAGQPAKAKKAKKDGKKDGKAPTASAEEEPSGKAAKAAKAAAGESPSVPKQSKKLAADKAADAADDAAAGGAAEKEDDKKPNRKQRAAGEWTEMNARTVFVGNLPVDDDSHQKKLRRHFAPQQRHRVRVPLRTRWWHSYARPPGTQAAWYTGLRPWAARVVRLTQERPTPHTPPHRPSSARSSRCESARRRPQTRVCPRRRRSSRARSTARSATRTMPTSSSRSRAASRRPSPPTARSSKEDTCGSTVSPVPLPAQSGLAPLGPSTP